MAPQGQSGPKESPETHCRGGAATRVTALWSESRGINQCERIKIGLGPKIILSSIRRAIKGHEPQRAEADYGSTLRMKTRS